ncbi:toxin VasX [Pseudomonas sp. NCHU5208]|uniref:toxin VasX n=1 Tax=unclassified Pseudomonas TaxID=196821 RepID=UPI003F944714
MSNNVFALSQGAACEAGKLIVQVVGKDHPTTQKLVICDEKNAPLTSLTQQDKPEIQTSDSFSSVLHVWDWEGQPKRTLCLEIEASEGGPIRLPLHDELRTTPRQPVHDTQWNQIVPVVPMTALPGSRSEQDLGTPVLVRGGFVYVFYRNRLWRELEVRQTDGKTTYHDVNVARHRDGTGFRTGLRRASGVALDDIWLPVQWNNRHTVDVQMCFSEIQLSAARLQRLEQDSGLRRSRCQSFDLRATREKFQSLYQGKPDGQAMLEAFSRYDIHDYAKKGAAERATPTRRNLSLHVFPISLAAQQRARRPGYEWLLDHPGRYICDLTGAMPEEAQKAAQAFSDSCENANPSKPDALLESGALHACVEKHLPSPPAGEDKTATQPAAELWQAHAAEPDVLQSARTRQLCAVLLEDPFYRLRHLKKCVETQQQLLQTCISRASQHPHHGSALLVQQMVIPTIVGGQKNPLHESIKKISDRGKRDINHFTATPERMLTWSNLEYCQQLLSRCLDAPLHQQALADHLSLDGFEYLAEFRFASQLLPLLATSPAQLDPLAASGSITDAVNNRMVFATNETPGQKLISKIANEAAHPLHGMFWPEVTPEKLMAPYQKPAQPQPNSGDGKFRPEELAKLENQEVPGSEPVTLNAALLAGLLQGGSLQSALVANAKACANALHEIYGNFAGAVEAAESALSQAQEKQRNAEQDRRQAQQARSDSRRDQAQARQERQAAEQNQQQAEAAQRQANTEARRRNQELGQARQAEQNQRAALGGEARPAALRLHGQGVEQLRGMMRDSFGEAVFIRRSAFNAGAHYLFGLEDLPNNGRRPIRMYGEYLDGQGNLLASSNQRTARSAGLEQVTGDHLVLVMPRNHRTAQGVRRLNQAIRDVMQAEHAQRSAQAAQRQASTRASSAAQETARARTAETAQNNRAQSANSTAKAARQAGIEARSGLQEAVNNLQGQQGNLYYRALNGKVFPASVLMLEFYNVYLEWNGRNSTIQQKGDNRYTAGIAGATIDTLVAFEALTYKFSKNIEVLSSTRKPIFTIPRKFAITLLGESLGSRFAGAITARLIGQTLGGVVMLGICLYDAWYAWRWSDDAMWGYLLMAGGAAIGVVSGFFAGTATLLGPAGWLALLLIGSGAGIVYWLSSTPLEDWLGNGPFGDNRKHPHLLEPKEAFYRLLGLFAGPTVKVETNPDYRPDAKLDSSDSVPYVVRTANTRIRIETHLPGLLGTREGGSIRAECRLRSTETLYQHGPTIMAPEIMETDIPTTRAVTPLAQIAWPGSLTLYVHTPQSRRWTGNTRDSSLYHEWGVRMQATLQLPDDTWIFPAPPPKTPRRDAASQEFSAQPEVFYPIKAALEL